tara:strand:- start:223 stop:1734 length:1512 start_codon:yes stop_codon:yes gene_type:complete
MKLIRLTTEDNNAIFENNFNADITIPKDGKIALQNVVVESPSTQLVITPDNNLLTYQVGDGGSTSVRLDLGTYSDDNYPILFNDIQTKLNDNTGFDFTNVSAPENNRRELGLEWRCRKDAKTKVNIEYQLGTLKNTRDADFRAEWVKGDNVRIVSTNNGECSLGAGLPAQDGISANCFLRNFMARGCGVFRAQLGKLFAGAVPTAESGFIFGLTSTNTLNLVNTDFTEADMTVGIRVEFDAVSTVQGFRYYPIIDGEKGTELLGGDIAFEGDYIELSINATEVQATAYRGAGAGDGAFMFSQAYTAGQELFPFMVFNGASNVCALNKVSFTESPYSNNPDLRLRTQPPNDGDLHAPPQPRRQAGPNFLQFASISVAEFLGYDNTRTPSQGTEQAVQVNYIADRLFRATILADAFLVLLDNIPLDSYDGFEINNQGGGARRNILAVVPSSNATGTLIYEPSSPYFIDIKNRSDILLRHIKARIVLPDYTPFFMDGLATLTILVS